MMNPNTLPRPEYPRPRLCRGKDTWMNLNGVWDFEIDFSESGLEREFQNETVYSRKILVPFAPESKLSGIEFTDFMPTVWYRRTFRLPDSFAGRRTLLHFGAVDYLSKVWVNGTLVGEHTGGYTPFTFDITDALTDGENSLVVYALDHTRDLTQPSGKQSIWHKNRGCVYTRTTGIWQTVWLESVPDSYISSLWLTPDIDNGTLQIRADFGRRFDGTVRAEASFSGSPVSAAEASCAGRTVTFTLSVPEAHLWSPEDPALYDLRVTAGDDTVDSYFGMRKIAIRGTNIELNGKPYFQRLVLDQGFYPDGIYTAPTGDDLRKDIEMSKAAGFNGARLHEKIFEPGTSYWADHLGYLIWGEYPNWGMNTTQKTALLSVLSEWLESVERDYSSPALIGWCPFNETEHERCADVQRAVYNATRAVDPVRPIIDTSGYVHIPETDVYDVHDYEQNPEVFRSHYAALLTGEKGANAYKNDDLPYAYDRPYFVSEFGGMFWAAPDRTEPGWGYGNSPEDLEAFYERFDALVTSMLENPGICAFCYTQLTDVMQEQNGIFSFARSPKFDLERLHAILSKPAAIEKA